MIDWNDNAKSAVRDFAKYIGFRETASYFLSDKSPTQTKTVADAVAENGGKWLYDDYNYLNFDSKDGWYWSDKGLFETLVCTREQFEAYVKEQEPNFKATRENLEKIAKDAQGDFVEVEQEGEKWTHEYDSANIKCRILATDENECWVLTEYGNKVTEHIDSLKPIKPTLTKAEAWSKLCQINGEYQNMDVATAVMTICDKHDIVEVTA